MKELLPKLSLTAALAILTFSTATYAQSEFVVSGAAAEAILDSTSINLATAEAISDACVALAEERGVAISMYVVDSAGSPVYVHRMDGQVWTNVATAEMKALTALRLRAPSKQWMNHVTRNPADEWQGMDNGLFANSGGLPIIVNNQLIGAIGIGGSAPRVAEGWSDEICGHKAMTEVLGPQPPLLEDLTRGRPAEQIPTARFASDSAPQTDLSSDFVVSNDAARRLFDANQISASAAKAIASGCSAWIEDRDGTATIAVIDNTNLAVHIERMDGQETGNTNTALLKAETALRGRSPTSSREYGGINNPSSYPRTVNLFNFYSKAGGIPVVVDGQIIGAVGVSGTGGDDEACAVAGLQAAFGDSVLLPVYP